MQELYSIACANSKLMLGSLDANQSVRALRLNSTNGFKQSPGAENVLVLFWPIIKSEDMASAADAGRQPVEESGSALLFPGIRAAVMPTCLG